MSRGYWVICIQSYEIEGTEIPKGRMDYYTSTRPIVSSKWRKATPTEVETMQWTKGRWFNLNTDKTKYDESINTGY